MQAVFNQPEAINWSLYVPLRQRALAKQWHQNFEDPTAEQWWQRAAAVVSPQLPELRWQRAAVTRSALIDGSLGELAKGDLLTTVIELGSGLSTRPYRLSAMGLEFVMVDFPSVQTLRRELEPAQKSVHLVSCDLNDWDFQWASQANKTVFIAEGLFHYMTPDQVEALINKLKNKWNGAHLIADFYPKWLAPLLKLRLRNGDSAPLRFGLSSPNQWSLSQLRSVQPLLRSRLFKNIYRVGVWKI